LAILESLDPAFIRDRLNSIVSVVGTPGASPPSSVAVIGGYDGTNVQRVKTTTDGKLYISLG